MNDKGRDRQRMRTRRDLLTAAARLMKDGRSPNVAEVAEEAQVSRATAYRYFPSRDALLAEAPIDGVVPTPQGLFANDPSTDPEERLDKAERALHRMAYSNESQLRVMLAKSLESSVQESRSGPIRQNRRGPLIAEALAPARSRFDESVLANLEAALALVFGTESLVVFSDVLGMTPRRARAVKSWAIRALVQAALEQSRGRDRERLRRD